MLLDKALTKSPVQIARETLIHLAEERINPTPENYARKYAEISGEPSVLGCDLRNTVRRMVALWGARKPLDEGKLRAIERILDAITFSAGVTVVAEDDTLDDVVIRADHAMYEAKRAGKNRVFVG